MYSQFVIFIQWACFPAEFSQSFAIPDLLRPYIVCVISGFRLMVTGFRSYLHA